MGAAQAAEAMCRELGISSLLRVDLEGLRASGENLGESIRALVLQQRLQARDCILTRSNPGSTKNTSRYPIARRY